MICQSTKIDFVYFSAPTSVGRHDTLSEATDHKISRHDILSEDTIIYITKSTAQSLSRLNIKSLKPLP